MNLSYTKKGMNSLEQTVREWLSPGLPADRQLALAAYGNDIALVQISESVFHLSVGNPWSDQHVLHNFMKANCN